MKGYWIYNQSQNTMLHLNVPVQTPEFYASLSYDAIGETANDKPVAGFDNDFQMVKIGNGRADFEKAKIALRQWAQYPNQWTKVLAPSQNLAVDEKVGVYFKLFGFWWENACQIIYKIDEPHRFGFAYGTLKNHAERGEELFLLEMKENEAVFYTIKAFSKPNTVLTKVAYPLVRHLQNRFRVESAHAMKTHLQVGEERSYFYPPTFKIIAFLGWILSTVLLWNGTFLHHEYGKLVLSFAAFITLPLCFQALKKYEILPPKPWLNIHRYYLMAAFSLGISMLFDDNISAKLGVLPYIFFGLYAIYVLLKTHLLKKGEMLQKAVILLTCVNFIVALVWLFADRWHLNPLGFGDEMVRLTALHFHYAGVVLPVIAGLSAFLHPNFCSKLVNFVVHLGIPLTGIGITATQFGFPLWIETGAALCMTLGGLMTAALLLHIYLENKSKWFLAAGILLLMTMLLSGNYALRWFMPHLDIAWMRALHGSINAFFFSTIALMGLIKAPMIPHCEPCQLR